MKKLLLVLVLGLIFLTSCNNNYDNSLRMMNVTMTQDTKQSIRDGGSIQAYYNNVYDYYCVSTYEKDSEEIAVLDEHEKCHALIKVDRKHFCEG